MRRLSKPSIPVSGLRAFDQYAAHLHYEVDTSAATIRNYWSDFRQFIAWCETTLTAGQEVTRSLTPAAITKFLLSRYRTSLQHTQQLKPASVNRALVALKRYAAWAAEQRLIAEVCSRQQANVVVGKGSGILKVYSKRNKYPEVLLNTTARKALAEYLLVPPPEHVYLFPPGKTHQALTGRALGHLVKKYATRASLRDVSRHDLRNRCDYRTAESVPLHRLARIIGHDSMDTTPLYIRRTRRDLQDEVEKMTWT